MKTFRLLTVLCVSLISLPPCCAVQAANPPTDKEKSAEEEVRRMNTKEVEAFLHQDPKAMEGLWSDDFVVTNPLNRFVTKQQVLGMVRSEFLVITSFERQIEYVKVYQDTVIVAGSETVTWGGKMPNAGKTEHLRFTGIWMMQNGRWQQVARHANIVPPK
jgi:hypothetical protein